MWYESLLDAVHDDVPGDADHPVDHPGDSLQPGGTPGSRTIALPRPVMISKDQLAILPNGNMVEMVGDKFRAPATELQIGKYQQSQHGTGVYTV